MSAMSAFLTWFRIADRYISAVVARFPGSADPVVDKIVRAYERHQTCDNNLRISVVAHSFGTLSLGRMLQSYPDAVFERAILYGCVLPRRFDWSDVALRQQLRKVLHEVCPRDRVVRMAC